MATSHRKHRASAMPAVFRFTFAHWAKQKGRACLIALAISGATVTEIFIPTYAGRIVDALAANARDAVLPAFAAMAALGVAMVVLRHTAWMNVISFTLRLMGDIAADAFARVQRLSTDWHANTFAGSTVRKITRGMWALDLLNDTLLLALAPSIVVLTGTVILLARNAPLLGLVMGVGAVSYTALTVTLATRWLAPAASVSNAWDTRMSGLLADAISSNSIVKGFGAEDREEMRLHRLVMKWKGRTRRTWTR
ncbi:MAG: ABC transporter transmembrane domain-containing protein, partial [Rhodospirillaceae bacterium]